ncbi:hypothetical protein DXX93_19720 [Thalassotalea euphylliae]|uniref:Twin-arginine translocation signal domain-containing protein n=1 Tax=Thalassotalea euphylliae TaxID=1655234 RepID=A0A3E0TW39_9GAMM|nr:hypothetical protein [Thalassotalea euphylliae]REL28573.1 hypothetical protein DXX93_19720 [Thalassotalea euphylliae]
MSDQLKLKDYKLNSNAQEKASESSRRRFIKKAAIGAPVVLASSTKPAWATTQCMSGVMSGNVSSHKTTCHLTSHNAKGHYYWKDKYVGYYHHHLGKSIKQECHILGIKERDYKAMKYTYYFRNHSNSKPLFTTLKRWHKMGHYKMRELLDSHHGFEQEIAAARLNAATCASHPNFISYPYTVHDVDQIYFTVSTMDFGGDHEKENKKRREVGEMLRGIRGG